MTTRNRQKAGTCLLAMSVFFLSSCSVWEVGKKKREEFKNKTVVVVGASSGFGRGVAEKLGNYHANVVLAARRTELLEEVAGHIVDAGGHACVVTTDVTDPDQLEHLLSVALDQFGSVDIWVNDAGVAALGPFCDIPFQDHAKVIDVNLKGLMYGTYIALRQFQKQGYGTIVNLGSAESQIPLAYEVSYAVSKSAIRSLGISLNQELRLQRQKYIKIVTVQPWASDTPVWRHAANYTGHTPGMILMERPSSTINTIIRRSIRPRSETAVGAKVKVAYFFHRICPGLVERIASNISNSYIQKAPPAPVTDGAVFTPMQSGNGIDDGVRERIRKEKH